LHNGTTRGKVISNLNRRTRSSREIYWNFVAIVLNISVIACNAATAPKISWSSEKITPAKNVELKLKGSKAAYCGYSVVDKAVDLVPNPNKITTPKFQELKEDLAKLRVVNSKVSNKCKDATLVFKSFERLGLFVLSDKLLQNTGCDTLVDVTDISKQREVGDDDYLDDITGIQYESDTAYGAAPSAVAESFEAEADFPAPPPPVLRQKVALSAQANSGSAPSRPSEIKKPKLELRNYFPETCMFDLVELDTNGEKTLALEAPHTITTWIAETMCIDNVNGAQVSKNANLLVTQDFFADIVMPYSVKRGEKFPLNISVFNTIDQKLPMTINLKKSQQFKVGRQEQSLCLQPQDNQIQSFAVKAKELHEVNITVEAKISTPTMRDAMTTLERLMDIQIPFKSLFK
jgi:hypothetical protein